MICPHCNQSLNQEGQYWNCTTHGRVLPQKSIIPLRIFLSYGHDGSEELVRQIKFDLEKRGHDVWFDKQEIKAGDDWRRAITDGILSSNSVLSFLSKHSTRDPGVCRDEIAIAIGVKGGNIQTVLVESEQEVQPPVNISYIQWLDMHDWKEQRAAGEMAWKQWYQSKLSEIVKVVESKESHRFAGEIETLYRYLKPIKSEARICQLLNKGYWGRQWLFDSVEKWRKSGSESRLFWITGCPGIGKSAFAAQLTHTRGDIVIAAQFCEWDKPDHHNAQRIVRSLAFQLATRLPDYRKLLLTLPEIANLDRKDAAELFDYLLANPLRSSIDGRRERHLIVIDALDEASESGRNPLVEMLARNTQRLPNWIGLVATSRPEFDVKTPLQALNPVPLDAQSESNWADIRDYLRHELAMHLQNHPDADHLIEKIIKKSEGVFLYVERFCYDIRCGHLSLDHTEKFPQGFGGILEEYFRRQFPDREKFRKEVRPALRAILAAREPLPIDILQHLFTWQDEDLRDFTRPLNSFFPIIIESGQQVVKPYHKSISEWLANPVDAGDYFVSVKEGHCTLAEYGWQEANKNPDRLSQYLANNLPYHLLAANRVNDFCTLLEKSSYPTQVREKGRIVELMTFCAETMKLGPLSTFQRVRLETWLNATPEDQLGKAMHEKWYSDMKHILSPEGKQRHSNFLAEYGERLQSWTLLAITHRARRWREVSEIFTILEKAGLGVRLALEKPIPLVVLTAAEIEHCAKGEHDRWCQEKRADKWTYAPRKDVRNLQTPYLVAWEHLSDQFRDYDRNACREWPELFARGGYEIYRISTSFETPIF